MVCIDMKMPEVCANCAINFWNRHNTISFFESCWPSWKSGFRKDKELYEMAVNALRAQQTPAKLDRTQWGGCDCCTAGDGEFRYLLDKWGDENYCPECGRPLTERAWAELEWRIGGSNETD